MANQCQETVDKYGQPIQPNQLESATQTWTETYHYNQDGFKLR